MPLLSRLLEQGRKVEVINGRLQVTPPPEPFPQSDKDTLLFEIATATCTDFLTYASYSTGRYGKSYEGVTVRFDSALSENSPYAIFNARLTRARNSKNGRKGARLPDGQFRITERFELYKFWRRCQLNVPPRLSALGDYMGNLKQVIIVGEYTKGERLDCKSLAPANISYGEILKAVNGALMANNSRTTDKQLTNNSRTIPTNKESPQSLTAQGLEPKQSTGATKYGNKYIREHGNKGNPSFPTHRKPPQEQTNDEWLEDWDQVGMESM